VSVCVLSSFLIFYIRTFEGEQPYVKRDAVLVCVCVCVCVRQQPGTLTFGCCCCCVCVSGMQRFSRPLLPLSVSYLLSLSLSHSFLVKQGSLPCPFSRSILTLKGCMCVCVCIIEFKQQEQQIPMPAMRQRLLIWIWIVKPSSTFGTLQRSRRPFKERTLRGGNPPFWRALILCVCVCVCVPAGRPGEAEKIGCKCSR